ncbi:MAG: acetylornithine/succinylornithine family transaminase [Polyangiaceae bacterium]|nr:acetylornithine/succinylornithine family transaminase [Polyangiaceae bacterium]MCW5792483.1 acetylornithine/succinylornithine family transaminase [Polyangiaceae bacterium]
MNDTLKGSVTSTQELVQAAGRSLYPNYRQPEIVFSYGQGAELFDLEGKRYIDLYAGIAVSALGHAHPRLTRAISEQAGRLLHLSNYYFNEPNIRLAERLCALTGMSRAFFCSSGTEAVESMLKLARRHFYSTGQPDRVRVIAFEHAFHGRTLGALAATGQPSYREGFGPLSPTTHLPYGDLERVKEALSSDVCAVIVEALQGEGGVLPAPPGFLEGLRELTTRAGVLLLADEVQTGVGRLGSFLGFQHFGVAPDALALAKGLGGGVPIGAMLCRAELSAALPPGSHGSTFGGGPLASAAAGAVLDEIEASDLIARARTEGAYLAEALQGLATRHSSVVRLARGVGLLQALVMKTPELAQDAMKRLRAAGVLVTLAGGVALRVTPPLNIERALLSEALEVMDRVLGEMA